jgi:LmbE family N-acetylglucosaminyl deacetylase
MNFYKDKTVIVLAPHTDDGELGCGGTVSRLIEANANVYYMAFSVCEQSVPYGFKTDELERELVKATHILGILRENVIIKRYEVRKFPVFRQEILQEMIDLKSVLKPDIVFMPSLGDMHQDHQVIAAEGLRAFKDCSILCYEMPWNNVTITTSAFFKLEKHHIENKWRALQQYKTQKDRNYANEEFIFGLAKARGVQIGYGYAEAFEVIRCIL